jgi:hypothetical protein
MSHFEYILTGELNDAFEEKTQFLLAKINEGCAAYYISEYKDEEINPETKKRTIIITSQINIWEYLYSTLAECKNNLKMTAYYKQRFM